MTSARRDALALVFGEGEGVRPLRIAEAAFQAMLVGCARQQSARHLAEDTKRRDAAMMVEFGVRPVQIIDERNAICHVVEYEPARSSTTKPPPGGRHSASALRAPAP